ncbi:MAG: OAM dimerization domain-containing protein [Pseudomonadota bacterium]
MIKINPKKIRAYGDRLDDSIVQLSFTLPVKPSLQAKEAARMYVKKMGLTNINVAFMEDLGGGFTTFVIYANSKESIDITKIHVPKVEYQHFKYKELAEYMQDHLKEPIIVVGATTGSDAHTVGLDAIMNMKGYNHDYGLERYPLFKAYNLRSQLSNKELIEKAAQLKADVILISQIVTQRDAHIANLKEFKKIVKENKDLSKDLITITGGPRMDHIQAVKLGFDAGFGPGTLPSQVASFIVHEYMKRKGIAYVSHKQEKTVKDETKKESHPRRRVRRWGKR